VYLQSDKSDAFRTWFEREVADFDVLLCDETPPQLCRDDTDERNRPEFAWTFGGNAPSGDAGEVPQIFAVAVDPRGAIMATSHPSLGSGAALREHLAPTTWNDLDAVLSGQPQLELTWRHRFASGTLLGVPIRSDQGDVLGALVLYADGVLVPFVQGIASVWGISVLIVTVFAVLVGSVFGFITARQLTKRLRGLEAATATWSQGDFRRRAPEAGHDEVAELGARLNRLASDLQTLLVTRQELTTTEERNRLARELHDSVKQQVFAASMQLATARALLPEGSDAAPPLGEADALVKQAQRELTGLIQELRPAALEGKRLGAALHDYATRWAQQTGLRLSLDVDPAASLPDDLEEALFRVAQEALANVAKHSYAEGVALRFRAEGGWACLQIDDDGVGFDPQRPSPGLGLTSMRERMNAYGGSVTITGCGDGPSGVRVVARVPLRSTPR
jgi:NarL family two-component system sensor histidine kinase LiaS